MSDNNDYTWIKNLIYGIVIIYFVLFSVFCKDKKVDNHNPMDYLKHNSGYVGMWQNTKKDMSSDILRLKQCGMRCEIIFYENDLFIHSDSRAYPYYHSIKTDIWFRPAVRNRIDPFIKNGNVDKSSITETLTLSDDGKTLTSVVSYYDKVNKKSVQLGEQYTYHKLE